MKTVVICVGRNVGTTPMPAADWAAYGWELLDALQDADATILQRPRMNGTIDQLGLWENMEEEAVTFVAFVEDRWVEKLADQVRRVRTWFKQDAAAFIVADGTENLV